VESYLHSLIRLHGVYFYQPFVNAANAEDTKLCLPSAGETRHDITVKASQADHSEEIVKLSLYLTRYHSMKTHR
jgi:hypothetical protein